MTDHEGIEMVSVCAGSFTMGSPDDEEGRRDNETAHTVHLTRDFWIGVYEVTQEQYEDIVGENPSENKGGQYPVESVSWYEAQAFANLVSKAAGLPHCYDSPNHELWVDTPYDCEGYRLPTEAEWEYAARAGTDTAFSNGGNLLEYEESNCASNLVLDNGDVLGDYAVYCANSDGRPEQVGGKRPNSWGLYDVQGNVDEWCFDNNGVSDYACCEATDPFNDGPSPLKVYRGGRWVDEPRYLRSAERSGTDPLFDWGMITGFRLARTIPEAD